MEMTPEMLAKGLGLKLQEEGEGTPQNVIDLTTPPDGGGDNKAGEGDGNPAPNPDSSLTNPKEGQGNQGGETPRELTNDEVFSFLSERLGRDVSSLDDLQQKEVDTNSLFASERLQTINDFVKNTGRTVEEYLATQSLNTEDMTDVEAVAKQLALENPELSSDDIHAYIQHTYKQSEEGFTESEKSFGNVQLKRDAKKAKDYFNKLKADYSEPIKQEEGLSEEAKSQWIESMKSSVKDVEGIEFAISDKETFNYNLDDAARESLVTSNSNLDNFFEKYVGEDGKWDFDSLNKDIFILNNFEDILRSVANQYKGQGTEDIIKDIKNPSTTPDRQSTGAGTKSWQQQLADELFSGRNKSFF